MGSILSRFSWSADALCHAKSLGLFGLLLISCGESQPSPPAAMPESQVLFRICRDIQNTAAGLVCMPSAAIPTVLWIARNSCDALQVTENDRALSADTKFVRGGCQLRPKGQSTGGRSTIKIIDLKSGFALWSLQVERNISGLFEQTDRMWSRALPDLETANADLDALNSQRKEPHKLLDIANARATILIRRGESEQAISALAEVAELAMRLGFPSIAFESAVRRMVMLRLAGLPEESDTVRRDATSLVTPGASWDEIQWAWHSGLILRAQEQLKPAEEWIRKATEYAERVDDVDNPRVMLPIWADVLIALDRMDEAQKVLNSISKYLEGIGDCQKAGLLANLGWLHLQMVQGEVQPTLVASPAQTMAKELLRQALALRFSCQDNASLANIHNGLAHVAFSEGRIAEAKAAIEEARSRPGISFSERLQTIELEARILLKEGKHKEALSLFQGLEQLSLSHPNERRQLFKCQAAIGSFEALQSASQEDPSVTDAVRDCISAGSRLPDFEQRVLRNRASALGLMP